MDTEISAEIQRSRRAPFGKTELDAAEIARRKKQLKREVERLVAKWGAGDGVKVSGITIRQMKTRWGPANVQTHHININLALLSAAGVPRVCRGT